MNSWLKAALVCVVLPIAGCTGVPAPIGQAAGPPAGPVSFAPLVKRVAPAVVNIAVIEGRQAAIELPPELRGTPAERLLRDRLRRQPIRGAGAGFIIDPSGIIVTNSHVVGHASRITVTLPDGEDLPGRVIGVDPVTDIAVIRIETDKKLPYVSWGDSRAVEVGDWILAAGNPFGVGASVTAGIVSARGRDIGAGPFDDFLQIDAPINPGNSGGPTFNMRGEVIAVNTAIVSPTGGSVGIGFAVPSEIAKGVVDDLRQKGRIDRGWLGVAISETQARGAGVRIATVDRTGPGAHAGLQSGDIITAVNGNAVATSNGLVRAVAGISPGGNARLSVTRNGRPIVIDVTVGRRPTEPEE
ncbi:MAG: trypsin-like peptidase domain-containing protein [Acetobacteraceae bacterium]|nr:trypsin-like peptidase domain-containing protein [Acetobacteraceae bacterium]